MRNLLLIIILCFANNAFGRFEVIVTEQVIEEANEMKARRSAIDNATDQVTQEMVIKEIGTNRFQENQAKVKDEVIPLKNRFIPYFKIISSKKDGESYRF